MISPKVFSSGIGRLAIAYGAQIPKARIDVYYHALKNLGDDHSFPEMCARIVQKCRFFPSIADFVSESRNATPRLEARRAFRALLDDNSVQFYNPNSGTHYDGVAIRAKYGDAVADAFEECGGDDVLCNMLTKDRPFVEAAFLKAYAYGSERKLLGE